MQPFTAILLLAALALPSLPGTPRSVPPSSSVPSNPFPAQPPPVRVVILYDVSTAGPEGFAALLNGPLTPLFNRLKRSGGEICAGVLAAEGPRPLPCVHIAPPPPPPALFPLSEDPALRTVQAFHNDLLLTHFVRNLATSLRAAEHQIERFQQRLLSLPVSSRKTGSMAGAVRQAEDSLQEKVEGPHALSFAVLITAREDAVRSFMPLVTPGATYLVVTPARTPAPPLQAPPLVFARIEDAVAYIARSGDPAQPGHVAR